MKCSKIFPVLLLCVFIIGCDSSGDSCKRGSKSLSLEQPRLFSYSDNAHPYLACAAEVEEDSRPCNMGCLPLIGQETKTPTKQDIESRLLVSHQWMGERFMSLLDEMPEDMPLLLRSVTAIVIDSEVRPSFYTTQTGAIYLDPGNLWLTEKEKKTISSNPDYRSGFASELNFTSFWRYLKPDGSLAITNSADRELDDLVFPLSRLLYHELAHANTFFPPSSHEQVNLSYTPNRAVNALETKNGAEYLSDLLPLESALMKELAYVLFRGEDASNEQLNITAAEVGAALESDRANDDYAYVPFNDGVYYEDIAMLFEELMSKYHFNYDREIAYTNAEDSSFCNDYMIAWGQTGRIGDAQVKEAARVAVARLIPESNLESFIDNLEAPVNSPERDWCAPFEVSGKLSGKSFEAQEQNYDVRLDSLPPHAH